MDAQQAADHVIKSYWGNSFPVDPVTIAQKVGITVNQASLPSDVSGAIIKEKGKDPVILLEASDSNGRKRFSCAHELGHFMRHAERIAEAENADEYEFIDLRNGRSSQAKDDEEIYANQFAANLLMPETEVRKQWAIKKSAIELATYFGVSSDAMSYRLANLKIR